MSNVLRARSLHRRHHELRAFSDPRRPARSDGLQAREETHALGAVNIVITEQGTLPAAEAVERDRDRDRYVDADHADLHARGELACGIAIAREDRDPVAVFMRIDQLEGLIEIGYAHDRQHRPEDLFAIDAHAGLHVVEQAPAQEESFLVARHTMAASVHHQLRAFLFAGRQIAGYFVEMLP